MEGTDHPDTEFTILVESGPMPAPEEKFSAALDHWLYQHRGKADVVCDGQTLALDEGCCVVIPMGSRFTIIRPTGSIGLFLLQQPQPVP